MHGLNRSELIQATMILINRHGDLLTHIKQTDYAEKFGQDMGEKIKYDDEQYAHDIQTIIAKLGKGLEN